MTGIRTTAFEVELPHQVLLALQLAGPAARLLCAPSWSMPLPDRRVPAMGGAIVRLEHVGGLASTLLSDLTAPVRRRHLAITGTRGEILADYQVSADDPFGQLRVTGRPGREVIEDAPLNRFLAAACAHFAGTGAAPPAGLALHRQATELLEEARDRSAEWLLDLDSAPLGVPAS